MRTGAAIGLLCFLMVLPCRARTAADAAVNKAFETIKRRRLLTAAELQCSTFIAEDEAKGVTTVAIREKHGRGCPGDPEIAPLRFRMEVDRAGKRIRWNNNIDMEMRPVP